MSPPQLTVAPEREQRSGPKSNFRFADLLEPEPFASKHFSPEAWRNLVDIEIPPDDEVSRVSRADLFLKYIG